MLSFFVFDSLPALANKLADSFGHPTKVKVNFDYLRALAHQSTRAFSRCDTKMTSPLTTGSFQGTTCYSCDVRTSKDW